MASGDIVLQFGLQEGRNADALIAAESLIAWVQLTREAALAVDPTNRLRVELLGREKGSLRQLLRLVDDTAKSVSDGADDYPYLKKLAVGLAAVTATASLTVAIEQAVEPDVQKVELSEPDRALAMEMRSRVENDAAVSKAARRFYRTVERDPAITEIQIADGFDKAPIATVPRSEFAERGGLWEPQEDPPAEEKRTDTWDVVLLKAPFVHEPRAWTFSRDGLPFSARMEDPTFLAAIAAGTVPITLQEGVMMKIEVEYRERLIGQVWEYVDKTRKVTRVLAPRPLLVPSALPLPDPPKED